MVILNNDVLGIIYSYLPVKYKLMTQKRDLVSYILSYLPIQDKMLLNKRYYNLVENHIKIKDKYKDKFFINIVKNNMYTLLNKHLVRENTSKWFSKKKFYFENNSFNNLFSLLEFVSVKNKCNKCREILNKISENNMYNKNKHKNKIYKNIIWS